MSLKKTRKICDEEMYYIYFPILIVSFFSSFNCIIDCIFDFLSFKKLDSICLKKILAQTQSYVNIKFFFSISTEVGRAQ